MKLVEVVDDPEEDNLYMGEKRKSFSQNIENNWVSNIDLHISIMSFSAFEFLEKGELLEIPTEKPLSEDETWRSFRDVISGLEYCELVGVYISTSNPIISSDLQY